MKKRNAKTLVMSLSLMLVMCVATALLSFSLADPATGDEGTGADPSREYSTTRTNIDYIIENSASAGKDESGRDLSQFYIVEIGSAGTAANSPLAAMVAEDTNKDDSDISQFVKQVINGWSTENKTMVPDKISYAFYSVASLKGNDTLTQEAITAVSKADLIYVSNDPSSKYSASKDIPEDLKLILSAAATSKYIPFIIDSPTKTQQGGNNGGTGVKTYTMLAQDIFSTAGIYRNGFSYDMSASGNIERYLNRLDRKSLWLPIYGRSHSANWYVDEDGKKSSRILTIQKDDADVEITNKFKEATGATAYDLSKLTTPYPDFDPTGKEAYEIAGTTFYKYGYSTSETRPDNVIYEKMNVADVDENTDLSVYDLIILEKGVATSRMSDELYNRYSALIYGLQHIVYDSSMGASSQGEDNPDIVISDAVNYQFVVNKVADANEKARFTNVLVTGMAEMQIYGAASSPSGVKAIADILNNGSYRGSGGGGSSSNLYTVLEIQPCYPIDLNLAKALQDRGMRSFAEKGRDSGNLPENDRRDIFYYLKHDSVLNGKTSDEISFDGGLTSLSEMEATDDATTGKSVRGAVKNANLITTETATDYYAWELSRAKIAHLTGLPYNKVNVVHMSTVEFNTSRNTLADNYDAIYIGGKNTAIKDIRYIPTEGRSGNAAVYNMYFHNGGTYNNGSGIGVLTGNDITYDKYVELQSYVASGMPLIFTKDVSDAYYDAVANKYRNNLMDPDSNIYKLMALYMSGEAVVTASNGDVSYPTEVMNVLAGFDSNDLVKIPNGGDYGLTYGGYVTVFGGINTEVYVNDGQGNLLTTVTPDTTPVNAEELSALLQNPVIGERPKFSLLQAPATYVEGDDKTEIQGNTITFKYDIASQEAYTINVYADSNTNSRFEDDEKMPLSKNGNKVVATFASSFDGALYWKFEVVSGDCKSSVTGLSKVTVKNKNYVNVLQITPEDSGNVSINGKTTLLFCTECQEARGILKGNRYQSNGKYTASAAINETFTDGNYGNSIPLTIPNPQTYDKGYKNVAVNKNLGIHRHNFGIVKYDSHYSLGGETGLDNWETNWAEDLYRDYDMDIDIWTTRDFETFVKDAMTKVTVDNANDVLENYKTLASIYKNYYLTMKSVIDGKADESSVNYKYLKNKLTRTDDAFVEADVNQLFGEEKAAYDLETAQGGFHVSDEEFEHYKTAQTSLDALLTANTNSMRTEKTTKEQMTQEIAYETKYHRYSDFFSLFNAPSQIADASANFYNNFVEQYAYWRNAMIYEQYFYKMYIKYLTYSTMKLYDNKYYPDFTEVFSCIVVGVGENFGDDDIKTMEAINALKFYIQNEGNTFIFHQTINDGGNTPMMTNNLKTDFGQNYNHITTKTVTETALTYDIRVGNSWEQASAGSYAEGAIKEGQGIDVAITFGESTSGLDPTDIKVSPNNTGKIVVSWTRPTSMQWSNRRIWFYINGNYKCVFDPSNIAVSGTNNNVGTITESAVETTRVINENPTDTDRYHYTPLLNNGNTIKVSTKHLAMVNQGVWGNAEKFGQFMYTQTAVLNTDIQIPNTHKRFVSGGTNYGAFTDRATQTNKGVVTMYPFMIASELKISATHPNSFSTDIEDKDMVVYYALAGGSEGSRSSVVAADPQDGIDNYFIYTYGNVTYCGAGHTNITGIHRDNNDERRLFINIILNSVKKSVFGPTIEVFDPYPQKNPDGSTKLDDNGDPIYTNNDITKAEDGTYEMVVPNAESIPEFTYRVTIPDTADEVQSVKIYYDLTPNTSDGEYGFVKNSDVMIFEADAKDDSSILKNLYKLISKAIEALKLKPNYFQMYENKYTYIVIAVKTKKGIVTTQRIMIKIAPKLWDLT